MKWTWQYWNTTDKITFPSIIIGYYNREIKSQNSQINIDERLWIAVYLLWLRSY